MRQVSDTCDCDDPRFHPDGECEEETVTFRTVKNAAYALCRECSNNKHKLSVEA